VSHRWLTSESTPLLPRVGLSKRMPISLKRNRLRPVKIIKWVILGQIGLLTIFALMQYSYLHIILCEENVVSLQIVR